MLVSRINKYIVEKMRSHLFICQALLALSLLFCLSEVWAKSESIHLQLRWLHQFQFAGYYAALEKGYYQDEGLDVIIHAGSPEKQPVKRILNGEVHYGVANSELLLERLRGAPLVALAAIFQHSPSVLLARKDADILSPHDLVGKKVMMIDNNVDADFVAMFKNEGIDLSSIKVVPSSYNIQDLVDKKVVAFNSYLSNEPFFLQQQNIDYTVLHPRLYEIDFYSDILFTTEQEIADHPDRVNAFLRASLKGWRYALQHPQEIIDLLLKVYSVDKSKAHLEFEAKTIENLILPNLVEIGHMNPWRWKHMADTFFDAGMLENLDQFDGFIYQPGSKLTREELMKYLKISASITLLASLFTAILFFAYKRTKREIQLRIKAENEIKKLAYSDSLTGLENRHHFFILADQSLKQAERDKSQLVVAYLDLDDFKTINDQYGHKVGDFMLLQVGNVLRQNIRKSDVAARLGGDEFSILFTQVNDLKSFQVLIEELVKKISRPVQYQSLSLSVNVSVGLAVYPKDGQGIDSLLEKADSKMYLSKFKRKNEIVSA